MRLFVAIELPDVVTRRLAELQEAIRGISWTPGSNFHLTLKFIGDTDPREIETIRERLSEIAIQPFILQLRGVGYFPERGGPPRVLWVGLHKTPPQLFQLQHKVENALFRLGFDPGKRSYTQIGRAHV